MARFGRTVAVHVVEHVQERIEAPREPGFRGRFAGQELRRGMERDMALNFLSQFSGLAGGHPQGAGIDGPVSGSPPAEGSSLGTSGLASVGGSMGVAGPMGMGGPVDMAGPGLAGSMGMTGATDLAAPMGMAGPGGGMMNGGSLLQMGLGGGDMLTGSEFALNGETRRGGILSFWSRGAQSHFAGRDGALSLGADVRTTMFGADYAGDAGGRVTSAVTGFYPWLGYKATDRVTVWGVAGYGSGGLLLTVLSS